ncbi:MAG: glycosyl hydrolase family 18 protein [Bacteroidales bacterium]
MKNLFFFTFICFYSAYLFAQGQEIISIHQLESARFNELGLTTTEQFDSLSNVKIFDFPIQKTSPLGKRVFGYHPYWGGSNYLNYQWDLISDFCYFSYEVDPATGEPSTIHDWNTSPAIDSALANDVKVHLCVTIFSGHAQFFTNLDAQQTLIENIIDLIVARNAHGVNMDVEALPSAYKEEFMDFMIALCSQMETELPEAEVSIAAPAVNWSEKFNIPALNEIIDFFMVMGYDYYWNGSSQAGPVSPLYPMMSNYSYCFSRTISYYQSQGVPGDKLVMGVPYYAYQWPTAGQFAPSATTGNGSAFTYANIMNNTSGNYGPENKHLEPNSFGPYYSFNSGGWKQCFLDDVYSMGEKYDIINRRGLAGIGIWALGYDNGYADLWNLINDKFTEDAPLISADTIFDTGGPAFDYNNNEIYTYTISTAPGTLVHLGFSYIETEAGYDTLWIYDGPNEQSPLIALFSGDSVPEMIPASSNSITLKFYSDAATTESGWRAIYDTMPVSGIYSNKEISQLLVYPNPAKDYVYVTSLHPPSRGEKLRGLIYSSSGQVVDEFEIINNGGPFQILVSSLPKGYYTLECVKKGKAYCTANFIVR